VRVGAAAHAVLAVAVAKVVVERVGFEDCWLNIPVIRVPTIAAMMTPHEVIIAARVVTLIALLFLMRRGLGVDATDNLLRPGMLPVRISSLQVYPANTENQEEASTMFT
jgi:hypothetical protein